MEAVDARLPVKLLRPSIGAENHSCLGRQVDLGIKVVFALSKSAPNSAAVTTYVFATIRGTDTALSVGPDRVGTGHDPGLVCSDSGILPCLPSCRIKRIQR